MPSAKSGAHHIDRPDGIAYDNSGSLAGGGRECSDDGFTRDQLVDDAGNNGQDVGADQFRFPGLAAGASTTIHAAFVQAGNKKIDMQWWGSLDLPRFAGHCSAWVERYASVRAFVPMLCATITFGATADAAGVLSALRDLPPLLNARVTKAVPAGCLDARQVAVDIIPAGWWQRLVFKPDRPKGTVDRAAYVFCVLEQFHRHLIRRDIYATPSARYGDPRRAARNCSPAGRGKPRRDRR